MDTKNILKISGKEYNFFDLNRVADKLKIDASKLPYSLKILLENLLRHEDGESINEQSFKAIAKWLEDKQSTEEILFFPARVLMQDFTGVPAVVDLASIRNAVQDLNCSPDIVNPLIPVDLVIDHSIQVDSYGSKDSLSDNIKFEMQRNQERYEFLKWGQNAFQNFRVVPPGVGICHQVNIEYLANVVQAKQEKGEKRATLYPDTLVGTDSHTTMVNGLSVLGWGVGGIEAESVMLGNAISMIIPEVIGVELVGRLQEGITATDLVLTITSILRQKGVVGKFVEFCGSGLKSLSLADRATIANMAPEYGATCGFFPIDQETIKYLQLTGRTDEQIEIIEAYSKAQGLWHDPDHIPVFTDKVTVNLSEIETSIAGPKRPQDRIALSKVQKSYKNILSELNISNIDQTYPIFSKNCDIKNGSVVIAAITSCTNTSNPSVLIAAGLIARKAIKFGLKIPKYVKTSFAPGSQAVTEYLKQAGLMDDLEKLGFYTVGYGCTTCIGNSGPLNEEIEEVIKDNDLNVVSVLSGNRNFEGRVHPLTKANYLASPPLVVVYALLGNMQKDIVNDSIGISDDNQKIYLKDLWPTNQEINNIIEEFVAREIFVKKYQTVFDGDANWQNINVKPSTTYNWSDTSTYIKNPPYFDEFSSDQQVISDIKNAKILALFGDSITTDHISPAGVIALDSPAAKYLKSEAVDAKGFNSYGSRRGNHEVMMRGTFANIRIKNKMADGKIGGYTRYLETGEIISIYDAAMRYKESATPLIVIAGKEYGTGSSRDWAAKGTLLLGVKAVIAESFERIHRSNLVGMGVLPLSFINDNQESLAFTGEEEITISALDKITPKSNVQANIKYKDGSEKTIDLLVRIDTELELDNFRSGGVLQSVVKKFLTL